MERQLLASYRAHFVNPGMHDEEFWEIVGELGIPLGKPSGPRTPPAPRRGAT